MQGQGLSRMHALPPRAPLPPHRAFNFIRENIFSYGIKRPRGPNVSGNFLVTLPFPSSPLLPHFPLMIKVKTFMEMERGFYEGRKESFYRQNAILDLFLYTHTPPSPFFPLLPPFPPLTPSSPHKEEQEKD